MSLLEEALEQSCSLRKRTDDRRVRLVAELLKRQPPGELDAVLSSLGGKEEQEDIVAFQLNPYGHPWTTEYAAEVLCTGGVPFLPDTVERKDRVTRIRSLLEELSATAYPTRVLLLYGAGGMGKTTLAADAVRDPKLLVDCFHDGVIWMSTGPLKRLSGLKLTSAINLLLETILKHPLLEWESANSPTHWPADWVKNQLARRLNCKRLLLVLDDVSSSEVLAAFETLPAVLLVTSRRRDVTNMLLADARFIEVAACSEAEGLQMVHSQGCSQSAADLKAALEQSQGNPLLLSVMTSTLFKTRSVEIPPNYLHHLPADCWALATAVYTAIQDAEVCGELHLEGQRRLLELYLDLAGMRDGEVLVSSQVAHLWQLSHTTTITILDELASRKLLLRVTPQDGAFQLHDVLLELIRAIVTKDDGNLDQRHRRWIESDVAASGARDVIEAFKTAFRVEPSANDSSSSSSSAPPADVLVDRMLYHFECLEHPHELQSLLVDERPRWLRFLEDRRRDGHVARFVLKLFSLAALHPEQLPYKESVFFQLGFQVAESIRQTGWNGCLNRFMASFKNSMFSEEQQRVLRLFADVHDSSTDSTPLHWVAAAGDVDAVKLLATFHVDVDAKNADWKTPLHYAAWGGHLTVVKELLALGADVSATDRWDEVTPLHLAAESGHKETAEMLLVHGAYVNAVDKEKRTPMRLAIQRGHGSVINLLSAHGAV